MRLSFGQHIDGVRPDGEPLRAAVFNENEVRAAAGLTLVVAAYAFTVAYFTHDYTPLQIVTVVFFLEFTTRLTFGLRYSPFGVVARALTRRHPPDWVSAKPKRFAWTLGLGMASAMVVITNSGIRGTLPRTVCLICMTLMWMESVLGVCLGCRIHALLVRRGWTRKDPAFEICSQGACELPARSA